MDVDDRYSQLNPQGIFDLFTAYWKTGIIKAAVNLDVFSGIAAGEDSIEKLALSRGVERRGMRVLLDSLCGLGLLNKQRGIYALGPEADCFLVKGKPTYLGGVVEALVCKNDWEVMGRIEEAIRGGGPLKRGQPESAFWENVARALVPGGLIVGQSICDILNIMPGSREKLRVLDIACGSGVYGYSVLKRSSEATATAFDLEPVLRVAEKIAGEMGVARRVRYQAGNIEEPNFEGNAFDIAIVSHILQAYDPAAIQTILKNVHGALAPGGRLVIHDFVPDEERAIKIQPLLFAVYMLVVTRGGGTYTFSEYSQWLGDAGYRDVTLYDLPAQTSIIVAKK